MRAARRCDRKQVHSTSRVSPVTYIVSPVEYGEARKKNVSDFFFKKKILKKKENGKLFKTKTNQQSAATL